MERFLGTQCQCERVLGSSGLERRRGAATKCTIRFHWLIRSFGFLSSVLKGVRETYEKFKIYGEHLKQELSNEIDFLYEVENELAGITLDEPDVLMDIKRVVSLHFAVSLS